MSERDDNSIGMYTTGTPCRDGNGCPRLYRESYEDYGERIPESTEEKERREENLREKERREENLRKLIRQASERRSAINTANRVALLEQWRRKPEAGQSCPNTFSSAKTYGAYHSPFTSCNLCSKGTVVLE